MQLVRNFGSLEKYSLRMSNLQSSTNSISINTRPNNLIMLSELIDQISDIISTETRKTVRITVKHANFYE